VPPSVDLHTDAKARALAKYFERTWVSGDFSASLWLAQRTQQSVRHIAPDAATVSRLAPKVPVRGAVSADAAGSRKTAEAKISGVREAGRRSVRGKDVVQCAVRAHFSASSSRTTRPSDYGSSALLPSTIWLE